ncbi:MAG: LamG domain-containing protein [Nanoarchaeota archaeon]
MLAKNKQNVTKARNISVGTTLVKKKEKSYIGTRRAQNRRIILVYAAWSLCVIVLILLISKELHPKFILGKAQQPYASIATRSFSGSSPYFANDVITVSVTVKPKNDETFYGLEEHIPQGFIVIESGDANFNQAQNVLRWVALDYENPDTPLPDVITKTYTVQAPASPGIYDFVGLFQFEDDPRNTNQDIAGPTVVQVVPGGLEIDDKTIFLAKYDNSAVAEYSDGGTSQPSGEAGLSYAGGVFRQGLSIDSNADLLTYSLLNNLLWNQGAIEFWVKPAWNPSTDTGVHIFFDASLFSGVTFTGNTLRIGRWYDGPPRNLGGYLFAHVRDSTGTRCYEVNTIDSSFSLRREPVVSQSWQANTWHHIVFSWRHYSPSIDANLYVDGQLVAHLASSNACGGGNMPADFRIGNILSRDSPADSQAAGMIEELRISNDVRFPQEILADYEQGLQTLGPYCSYNFGQIVRPPNTCIDKTFLSLYCDASARIREQCRICGGCPAGIPCTTQGLCRMPPKGTRLTQSS